MNATKRSVLDSPLARTVTFGMLGASVALLLSACKAHHDSDPVYLPVFVETEPNDDELTANDFGVLYPGDRFIIDGFASETDLDGFWFTAGEPIHVDFQLFVAAPFPDLDVCLFDPQLGETVACFETSNNPERGGVDVTAGGVDFHLVVNSFSGAGSYSLEIAVTRLFLARSSATSPAQLIATHPNGPPSEALVAERATNRATFDRYASKNRKRETSHTIVTRSFDPETGESIEITVFRDELKLGAK